MKKDEEKPNYEFYMDFSIAMFKYFIQNSKNEIENLRKNGGDSDSTQQQINGENDMICHYEKMIKMTHRFYEKNNRRMLTIFYNSTIENVFEGEDYEFIDQYNPYFIEKYGIDLYSLNVKLQKKIEKIITRGKIRTDDEFRLINERVDELCQNDGDAEMIEACNKMLLDYEERAAEKLNKRKKKSES